MAKEYRIDKLVRGSRKASSGDQTGVYVTLTNMETGKTNRWPTFLSDYHDSEAIAALEDAGEGGKVAVGWVKNTVNGKDYYNIKTVTVVGAPGSKPVNTPRSTPEEPQQEPVAIPRPEPKVEPYDSSQESVLPVKFYMTAALDNAVKLTQAMLSADPRFKSLLKATKTTEPLIVEMTLANAYKFKEFLEEKYNPTVTSNDSDLEENPVEPDEPSMPDADDDDGPI